MIFLEILFLKDIRIVNGGNIMQCSCGREMTDRFSVSQQFNLRWEYSLCQSCGKIGADYLHNYDKSQLLETGYSARIKYRDKTKNKKSN